MQRSWHRGCHFHLRAFLHHSDTHSSVTPARASGKSKLTVSTQLMFVAHISNHSVDHRGISPDQQLLLQRYLKLSFKWDATISPAIKKPKAKRTARTFQVTTASWILWRIQWRQVDIYKAKSCLGSHSLWPKYSAKIFQMKKVNWLAVISPLWIEENLQWENEVY